MKKNYQNFAVIILFIACLFIACTAKKSAILHPEQNLSIITGPPEKIEFILEDGEILTQNVIEIYGFRITPVKGIKKIPKLLKPEENENSIKMSSDSIELYSSILPGNYYSIIISSGPNYLCTLYDTKGYPIHPLNNFQLLIPKNDNLLEPHICNIINKKNVTTESLIIETEDFENLQKTNLCSLCYIELDKKDRIVSSGKVLFPTFGAIGNVIQKKADRKAEKIYIKVIYKGIFGVSVKPCDEKLNFLTI